MLSGIVTALQVFVHEEGFAGSGGAQQEYIVVLNQAQFHGPFLNVKAQGDQPLPVAHFENAVRNSAVEPIINVQAECRRQLHGHIFTVGEAGLVAGDGRPELDWRIGEVPYRSDAHLGKGRFYTAAAVG